MDAFKSVDSKNLKKVYRSDGQGDWHRWRSGDGKNAAGTVKSNQYKRARHAPSFPKIGTNTAPEDASNLHVGDHEDVLIPENVARKKHRHWREELMEKEAAERKKLEEEGQPHQQQEQTEEEVEARPLAAAGDQVQADNNVSVLPQGWHEMQEPDTGKVYYFNASTGETTSSFPSFRPPSQDSQPPFIASKQFGGSKHGFIFHVGENGLGYYKDIDTTSSANKLEAAIREAPKNDLDKAKATATAKEPVQEVDPMIGRSEAPRGLSRKKMKKRKDKYGETLMDVVTRSLSEYASKHPAILPQSQPQTLTLIQPQTPSQPRQTHAYSQQGRGTAYARAVPPPRPPPIQWQVLRDPLTRRKYYYNKRTKEKQWEKPKGMP